MLWSEQRGDDFEYNVDNRALWPRLGVQRQHQLGHRQQFGVAQSGESNDTGSVGVADSEQRLAHDYLKELDAIYELYASSNNGPVGGVNVGGYQEVFSGYTAADENLVARGGDMGWGDPAPVCERGAGGQSGGGGDAVDDKQSITDWGQCELGRIFCRHD